MSNYSKIEFAKSNLNKLHQEENASKNYFVGKPLSYISELFKNITFVLGLDWFLDISKRNNLPFKTVSFPTITYNYGYISNFLNRTHGFFVQLTGQNYIISEFSIGSFRYDINILNFWAVPLHFIIRNLAKVTGWLIVSIFTVPAYLLIKSYYKVKKMIAAANLTSELAQFDSETLAKDWILNNLQLQVSDIAKHVNGYEYFKGQLDAFLNKNDINLSSFYHSYSQERKKILFNEQRFLIIISIIFGITGFPLFYTIPKLKQHNEELMLLELETGDIYDFGKKLLEENQQDLGFDYLSNVPVTSPNYKKAMYECGSLLLADGQHESADYYFGQARDTYTTTMAKILFKHPGATVYDITNILNTTEEGDRSNLLSQSFYKTNSKSDTQADTKEATSKLRPQYKN